MQMLAVLLTEMISSPEIMKAGVSTQWRPSSGGLAISYRSAVAAQTYAGGTFVPQIIQQADATGNI